MKTLPVEAEFFVADRLIEREGIRKLIVTLRTFGKAPK
jgi:hypothetical protein